MHVETHKINQIVLYFLQIVSRYEPQGAEDFCDGNSAEMFWGLGDEILVLGV